MNPNELETLLAAKIEFSLKTSPNDTLLGFLDVDQTLQGEVLNILRECSGHYGLKKLLRTHPAIAVYGFAVAAPIGLSDDDVSGGAFYEAWRAAFGVFPSNIEREPLARAFIDALARLGLPCGTISPDHEIHWHGGCYLFHAAILPHFVAPLRAALKAAQMVRPMPDPEDDEKSSAFAHLLAQKTHPAQQRLRKVLESKVGSFLVKRLVRWHLTGDNALFPAHIQPLLAEQRGHAIFLRNPYVAFDEVEKRLQLVLPAQTPAVADSQTRWTIGGMPPLRASSERPPIPLCDITSDPSFEVRLSQLRDTHEDITYRIEKGFPTERPFRLFDAITGKERKFSSGDVVDLVPGQTYLVVFDRTISIQSDHIVESAGELQYVRLEVLPRSEPLVLRVESKTWRLHAKVLPGLFFSREGARIFNVNRITDGKVIPVVYGEAVGLTCCITNGNAGQPKLTFSSTSGAAYSFEPLAPDSAAGEMTLYDVGAKLQNWLHGLPSAVHIITAAMESDGRRMTHEFYFWKGLQRISMYGDFHCATLPANLTQQSGFNISEIAIIRKQGHNGRPELAFRNLGVPEVESWEVPANRVKIAMLQKTGTAAELDENSVVDVLPDDDRVIQFQTGGLVPIRLLVNGTPLGEISPDKPLIARFLSSLVADFGKGGRIKAECVSTIADEKSWTVLCWRTPLAALECRAEDSPNDQTRWLIRDISLRGITGFRIKLTDVAKRIQCVESEVFFDLNSPNDKGTIHEIETVPGLTCSILKLDDEVAQIRIHFTRTAQPATVWLLEVECVIEGSTDRQPLMCCEPHGRLSLARLLFIGKVDHDIAPSVFTELFWGRPGVPLEPGALAWKLNGNEFSQWLDSARWLIESRHPTGGWKQSGFRFKSLYEKLSAIAINVDQAQKTQWWSHAVSTLNQHAAESQPVIVPCLLMAHGSKLVSTSLAGCLPELPSNGIVSRAFQEAFTYENHGENHDLNYVSSACGSRRIDVDYLCNYTGWNDLMQNRSVSVGKFKYNSWLESLRKHCGNEIPSTDTNGIVLLSPQHLVYCLFKAMQRAETLIGVSDQDHGHWLSGPISSLQTCGDAIASEITATLSGRTQGIPVEALWNPAKQVPFTQNDEQRQDLLSTLMGASCFLALLYRAKSRNLIDAATQQQRLKRLLGNSPSESNVEERLTTQTAIVLGTAPELFAFYFLHFTLSLR